LLDLRGGLVVERVDGFGELHRVQVGDAPGAQQLQGRGQPIHEGAGHKQPSFGGAGGEPQCGPDLLAGVIHDLGARPIQRAPVQRGEHLLLGGVQQREVPFEGDQQIHPPGVGQRVRGDEHVDLRDRRHMLEHVCESINRHMCRPPIFHKEIRAIRKPAP
jgi:hypothetical protein